jgi:hypothetical protein
VGFFRCYLPPWLTTAMRLFLFVLRFGLYVGTVSYFALDGNGTDDLILPRKQIYIIKGVELLIVEFEHSPQDGWFSCFVAVLFALVVYYLERVGRNVFGPFWARKLLGDYSFAIGIIFFTGFVHM